MRKRDEAGLRGADRMRSATRRVGLAAAIVFACAVIGFGAALDGYGQSDDPVALLGAQGVAHALAFNLVGFVLPGLLALVAATTWRVRWPTDAPWTARIGARLLQVSALAFALQGVLPLQVDLDAQLSRLHATAWTIWWVACVPAGALLAIGLRRDLAAPWLRIACAIATVTLPLCAVFAAPAIGAPLAQRCAFALWFAWLAAVPYGAVARPPSR